MMPLTSIGLKYFLLDMSIWFFLAMYIISSMDGYEKCWSDRGSMNMGCHSQKTIGIRGQVMATGLGLGPRVSSVTWAVRCWWPQTPPRMFAQDCREVESLLKELEAMRIKLSTVHACYHCTPEKFKIVWTMESTFGWEKQCMSGACIIGLRQYQNHWQSQTWTLFLSSRS